MNEFEALALAAAAKKKREAPQKPSGPGFSDYVAQAGAGSQVGIAQMAGFPVDAITGGINAIGEKTGLYGPIQNPVGGSQFFDELMQPIRKNVPEPSTPGLRVARRVGEEVGASAVAAPLGLASKAVRAAPGAFAATETASALGSGGAAAVANEVAPGNSTTEIIAQLLGGGVGAKLGSKLSGAPTSIPATRRSGIAEQRSIADDAYGRVRADQTQLTPQQTDDLSQRVQSRMASERMNPRLQPAAANVHGAIVDDVAAGKVSRLEDVEDLRRVTTRSLPANASPDDRRLAEIMKDEITGYIDSVGGPSAEDLRIGRDAHRRASAATSVTEAAEKATRRAASTGSGGNEINAMRQNLRRILDNQRLRASFKPEELKLMDEIVQGTAGPNALRRLSRFAPTSGGLSAMLGIGGTLASPAVALPIMAATEAAKFAGEKMTRGGIAKLLNSIAPERVLKPGSVGIDAVTKALLAARVSAGDK